MTEQFMEGTNTVVEIYRKNAVADDDAGGAQYLNHVLVAAGRGQIFNRSASLEMRAQGFGTDKFYDAQVRPATMDIVSNDVLYAKGGRYEGTEFRITSVLVPPMNLNSPRAFLKLQLERWDGGKILALD